MNKNTFSLIGLDKNFNMVSLIKYSNLQWRRKYLEAGTFAIEIPIDQYNEDFRYIYNKDRPELGVITQVNYKVNNNGYRYIYLSGRFLESLLNRHVVYPKSSSNNVTNDPGFTSVKASVEDVAFRFFNGFKRVTTSDHVSDLDMVAGENLKRGKEVTVERAEATYLGDTLYNILSLDDMSLRVEYDFVDNTRTFTVWKGRDLTQDNEDGNNPVIFSTIYGNCKNPDVLVSKDSYRNASVLVNDVTIKVEGSGKTESVQQTHTRLIWNRTEDEGDLDDRFTIYKPGLNLNDFKNSAQDLNGDVNKLITAMMEQGKNDLSVNYPTTINVDFTAVPGSYVYMEDFDLGDLCSVEVPEIGLSADARLIGCYEVMKAGTWTLTLEFGTPVLI